MNDRIFWQDAESELSSVELQDRSAPKAWRSFAASEANFKSYCTIQMV